MTPRALAEASARFPGRFLLGLLLLATVAGYLASRLGFEADYGALLPEDAVETQDLRYINARASGAWYVVIAVEATTTDRTAVEQWASTFAERLTKIENIDHAEARLPTDYLADRSLLFLPSRELERLNDAVEQHIERLSPFFLDLEEEAELPPLEVSALENGAAERAAFSYTADGRYLLVFARPTFPPTEIDKSRALFAAIERSAGQPVRFAGAHFSHLSEDNEIAADLERASLWAALLVALVLLTMTRRVRALAIVLLPVAVSITVTFAFAFVSLGHLNAVTGFLGAILFGIGIDFGAHMFLRYEEERRAGQSAEGAAVTAAVHTGRASLTSAATTTGAFLALTLADFRGFSEFGFIAAAGVVIAYVVTFVAFPALAVVFERRLSRRAAIAVLLMSATACSAVGFESNLDNLRGDTEAVAFEQLIDRSVGGSATPTLMLLDDSAHEDTLRGALAQIGGDVVIERVWSLRDVVPPDQRARMQHIEHLRTLLASEVLDSAAVAQTDEAKKLARLRELAQVETFDSGALPEALRMRFDGGGDTVVLVDAVYDVDSIDAQIAWMRELQQVRDAVAKRGGHVRILSGGAIGGRLFALVVGDGPYVLWATLLAVFTMLLLDFRSLKRTLWVFVPTALALPIVGVAMALLDIKLNIFNALIFPTVVGLGVDSSVHIMHRYRALGPGSIQRVLRHTGWATLTATLTTGLGFASTMGSTHRGLSSLGELALIGIGADALTSLVALPCALLLVERWRTSPQVEPRPDPT